jgi:hypothetical protein
MRWQPRAFAAGLAKDYAQYTASTVFRARAIHDAAHSGAIAIA